jgi:hypothetical protein
MMMNIFTETVIASVARQSMTSWMATSLTLLAMTVITAKRKLP